VRSQKCSAPAGLLPSALGNSACPVPTRLSEAERSRLGDRTEGVADRENRQLLGIDQDTLDRVVSGRQVRPGVIAKGRAFRSPA